jgi:hypothetical protein
LEKETNPTWEYFKLLVFVIFLIELVLFLIAMIFGRLLGYELTLTACFWFGLIVAACFALIISANLTVIFFSKLFSNIRKRLG